LRGYSGNATKWVTSCDRLNPKGSCHSSEYSERRVRQGKCGKSEAQAVHVVKRAIFRRSCGEQTRFSVIPEAAAERNAEEPPAATRPTRGLRSTTADEELALEDHSAGVSEGDEQLFLSMTRASRLGIDLQELVEGGAQFGLGSVHAIQCMSSK